MDVAKARLDLAVHPSGIRESGSHDEAGVAHLVGRLHALQPTLIVLEATGGLERTLVRTLAATALPVMVVNPR
jgi:transposase